MRSDPAAHRPTSRVVAVWLCALVVVTAVWVGGLVVPYLVNDLHRLPLEDVASGAHDPKGLWPYARGSAAGRVLYAALFLLGLPLMPLLGLSSAVAAAGILALPRAIPTPAARRLLGAVVLVGVVMAAVSLSPFGRALTTWALD